MSGCFLPQVLLDRSVSTVVQKYQTHKRFKRTLIYYDTEAQKKYIFMCVLPFWSFLWCSRVGSLFTSEEQKRLARDVFDTSSTHAGLVRDVTDTDC